MKRIVSVILFLLSVLFSAQAQKIELNKTFVNQISYPLKPVNGDTFHLKINWDQGSNGYSLTSDSVMHLFLNWESFKSSKKEEADYLVSIKVLRPFLKDHKIGRKNDSYRGRIEYSYPLEVTMSTIDGLLLVDKKVFGKGINIYTKWELNEFFAECAHKDNLKQMKTPDEYLKDHFKEVAKYLRSNFEVYNYPADFCCVDINPYKKFSDSTFNATNDEILSFVETVPKGKTLIDYKDQMQPFIDFYQDKLASINYVKYKKSPKKRCIPYACVYNLSSLYLYTGQYEKALKNIKLTLDFYMHYSHRENWDSYLVNAFEDIVSRDKIRKRGYNFEDSLIVVAKKEHFLDSMKHSYSNGKLILKNGEVLEGLLSINQLRFYVKGGDYNWEQVGGVNLKIPINEEKTMFSNKRYLAADIDHIETTDEIYEPVLYKAHLGGNAERLILLVYENKSIKIYNSDIGYIYKKPIHNNGMPIKYQRTKRNMIKNLKIYFADCPKALEMINKKDFKYSREMVFELARLYGE